MKKLFKSPTLIAALCLVTACKGRVAVDDTTSEAGLQSVVISANFTPHASGLRSSISERAQYISKDLRRISFTGIRVVFYSVDESEAPQEVQYTFDKDITCEKGVLKGIATNENTDGNLSLSIKDIKLRMGDYKVLIICNPTPEFKERTEVKQSFDALKADFVKDPFDQHSRPMMNFYTNADQLIKITKDQFKNIAAGKALELQAELKPNFAYASIFLDKIKLPEQHRVSKERFIFLRDVSNKKFRLFPEYKDIDLDNGQKGKYPIDANFSGSIGKSIEELKKDFDYLKDYANVGVFQKTVTQNVQEKFQGFIIPENTVHGADLHAKCVTRLIIGVVYSPDPSIPLGEDWLTIRNKHYSKARFETLIREIKKKASGERTPEEKELIKNYETLKPHFERVVEDNIFGYSSSDIQYYKQGIVYYPVPIRHFKDNELGTKKTTGRYGVVRNTLYMIHIAGLSKLGYGDPLSVPHNTVYDEEEATNSALRFTTPNIVEYSVSL